MFALKKCINFLNDTIGRAVSWLVLFMVSVQIVVVVMRYFFGIGSIQAQESIMYAHATTFMLAAGYGLLHDSQVRVDIFYRAMSQKATAWVNLLGTLFFLWPVCMLIIVTSLPIVIQSWSIWEGSTETSGIHAVFLLKSVMVIGPFLLMLQGVAVFIESMETIRK